MQRFGKQPGKGNKPLAKNEAKQHSATHADKVKIIIEAPVFQSIFGDAQNIIHIVRWRESVSAPDVLISTCNYVTH